MNKYYQMLTRIIEKGKRQKNKKGEIIYLLNEQLHLTPADLLDIFEGHNIARKKLKNELDLFMQGERNVEKYREAGITWWDYCGPVLVNSYPTYLEKLPPLIERINREKRNSKNYVLFLGATGAESNQAPCLSLVQFQIDDGRLVVSAYQRSSDANLGLPADIYHLYLMARQIDLPLGSITLNIGNVHVYENNREKTRELLSGNENVKFEFKCISYEKTVPIRAPSIYGAETKFCKRVYRDVETLRRGDNLCRPVRGLRSVVSHHQTLPSGRDGCL